MSQKRKSDERGIAHLLLIVIIVVVLAAIGFAGWKVYSNKKGTSNSVTTTSTPAQKANDKAVSSAAQSACLSKYHDSDLCKFVAAEAAAPFEKTPLKLTMTGTSGGQGGTWVMEQDGKGNNSLTLSGGGQTINTITLNGQVYTQTAAGGPWVTYGAASGSSSSSTSDNPASSLSDFASSLSTTTYTKLGKEACGSLTCFKYQVIDSTTPTSTVYVWFDTSQYLMRQYYVADSSSGDKMTMNIDYQKVTISKPSPVQDLSAGSTSTGQ